MPTKCLAIKRNGNNCGQIELINEYCKYHQSDKYRATSTPLPLPLPLPPKSNLKPKLNRCIAIRVNGSPCKQIDLDDMGYCVYHQNAKFKPIATPIPTHKPLLVESNICNVPLLSTIRSTRSTIPMVQPESNKCYVPMFSMDYNIPFEYDTPMLPERPIVEL
jgi:hypothetical protein